MVVQGKNSAGKWTVYKVSQLKYIAATFLAESGKDPPVVNNTVCRWVSRDDEMKLCDWANESRALVLIINIHFYKWVIIRNNYS